VFSQISEVTFGYIDWITQQVVITYQSERDRWMENQNSLRALRVRELLDGADLDIDAVTTAIRYPLRRTHLAVVVWRDADDGRDDVVSMERFVHQLADSTGAESSLFISVDRMTGWAWIPLLAGAAIAGLRSAMLFGFAACHSSMPSRPPSSAGAKPLPLTVAMCTTTGRLAASASSTVVAVAKLVTPARPPRRAPGSWGAG